MKHLRVFEKGLGGEGYPAGMEKERGDKLLEKRCGNDKGGGWRDIENYGRRKQLEGRT